MAKSLLLATNTATQTVTASNPITFPTIVRRFGNCISLNGLSITLNSTGYYDIDFNATFAGATTGDVTINVVQNNATVSGATATQTVNTALTEDHSIAINTTVRVYCPINSTITIVVATGSPTTVFSNTSVRVEKI